MQTVETLNEGLKRAYTLKITAKDIDKKVDAEVKRVAPQVRMPGFRPGKVPPTWSARCTARRSRRTR
jgi:trigger factor